MLCSLTKLSNKSTCIAPHPSFFFFLSILQCKPTLGVQIQRFLASAWFLFSPSSKKCQLYGSSFSISPSHCTRCFALSRVVFHQGRSCLPESLFALLLLLCMHVCVCVCVCLCVCVWVHIYEPMHQSWIFINGFCNAVMHADDCCVIHGITVRSQYKRSS